MQHSRQNASAFCRLCFCGNLGNNILKHKFTAKINCLCEVLVSVYVLDLT